MSEEGMRLNKFISDSGYCSRREADRLIKQGSVSINGEHAQLGTQVMPGDKVKVEGRLIKAVPSNKSDRIYIAYHKPVGITCTTEKDVVGNIIDAVGHRERIFPIGRLDKPSQGLIFLTSDGDIVNKILRAENAHDKEYIVTVDKPLTEEFVVKMSSGIPILDTVTKPCSVTIQSRFVFKIILTQGLNRQIRRMCKYLGYNVEKLNRTRIMNVSLGRLKPGQWRDLSHKEMQELNDAVAGSRSTAADKAVGGTPKKTLKGTRSNQSTPARQRHLNGAKTPSGHGKKNANGDGRGNRGNNTKSHNEAGRRKKSSLNGGRNKTSAGVKKTKRR